MDSFAGLQIGDLVALHTDTAGCTMDCTGYWNGGGEDQYSVDGGDYNSSI